MCYSEFLKATKERTIIKAVEKESQRIIKVSKALSKREFVCAEDANREIEKVGKKEFKKIKFHDICYALRREEVRKKGRPAKNVSAGTGEYRYYVEIAPVVNPEKVANTIDKACYFVLCTNDLLSHPSLLIPYILSHQNE